MWIRINGKGVRVKEKEKEKIENNTVIKTITYQCGRLDKEYTVPINENDFDCWNSECELCGEHGGLSVTILKCPCGMLHEIKIKSW